MSEKFDAELLSKFLDQLQKMIDLREEMIKWLQDFIEEVKTQERGVNGAKTGEAARQISTTSYRNLGGWLF